MLVNGNKVDLGGDYGVSGAEDISLKFPTRFLRPGDNVIEVKTVDYNGTLNGAPCAPTTTTSKSRRPVSR